MTLTARLAHDVMVVAQDEIDALLAVGRAIDRGTVRGLVAPDDVMSVSCSLSDPTDGTTVDLGRVIDFDRSVSSHPEFVMGTDAPRGCRRWVVTLSGSVTRVLAAERMTAMTSMRRACGHMLSEPVAQSDVERVQCDIRPLDRPCPAGIVGR